jgi:type II secretory pathway predicted ATPase ExeA
VIEKLAAHYGFTRMPYGRDLAPGMLHRTAAHGQALARITWCITERSLGVVTGEVGVGKTVAVRAAIAALDPVRHQVIYIPNPAVGTRGIYQAIATGLGQAPAHHTATLIAQATEALAIEHTERGRVPVVAIDEAHMLDTAQLEAIRMLTNSEMDSRSAFACLLIGQPTLKRKIKLGVLAALDQRIAIRCHMDGMNLEETAGYIRHHLALAGRADAMFSDDAIALIHQTSRGYPRAVNNLAIQSLLAAYLTDKTIVDEQSARAAITEVTAE